MAAARRSGRSGFKGSSRGLCEPLEQRHLLTAPPLSATIEGLNFDTTQAASTWYTTAPSPGVAVGPNHVLNVVGTAIQWHTKTGTLQNTQRLGQNSGGSSTGSFFASLSPNSAIIETRAVYDPHGGRFLVLGKDNAPGTSRLLVAVSDDSDPNGTWYYTAINSKLTVLGQECVAGWPGLAFSTQGVYVTAGMFNSGGALQGTAVWPINKTPWYSGGAASVTGPLVDQAGPFQPVQMFDNSPNSSDMFLSGFAFLSATGEEFIEIVGINNPFTAPTFVYWNGANTGDIDDQTVPVPAAPQLGTSTAIFTGDRRLQSPIFKDGFFWACNTIVPFSGPDANTATVHWYKYGIGGSTTDHGNIGGEDIAPGTHTFFPSIMVDDQGDMAVTFSASGTNIYPGAYYTSKYASDPAGTTQPSRPLAPGVDYYVRDFGSGNLWGFHSSIARDPSDNNAVWMYNEYAMARGTPGVGTGDGRWATRNGKIVILPPGGISGTCFWDHNFNGVKDGAEPGLGGVTVWVDLDNDNTIDSGEPTTTSAGDGTYSFSGLAPDSYNVRQIAPAGYFATNNPRTVTVNSAATTSGANLSAVATTYTGTASADSYSLSAFGEGTVFFIVIDNVITYTLPQNIPTLTFNLSGGTDTLTIDQSSRSASLTFTATVGTIQLGILPITHTGVESIMLLGGHAADTFNITTASSQPVTVDGGPATDTYNAINTGTSGPVVVVNGLGGDVLNVNTDNSGGARVDVNNNVILGAVNVGNLGVINVNGPGTTVLRTSTLSMNSQARINLTNNNMIVDYTGASPLPTIQGLLTSGYAGGNWTGFGIRTSQAFTGSTTSLGYAEATDLFSAFPATFAGQQVDNTSILIKYTFYGDADLSGTVNLNDFNRLAANFGQSSRRWSHGDFDFSTNVNLNDFNRLASNFGLAGSAPDWRGGFEQDLEDEKDLFGGVSID